MKLFILKTLVFLCMEFSQSDFLLIDGFKAVELREQSTTVFIELIQYNNCQVYKLKDSSYLVIPMNPFANSIIVYKKSTLEYFIKNQSFPVPRELSSFYYKNKQKIDKFKDQKDSLKINLVEYLNRKDLLNQGEINFYNIDKIFSLLKSNKKIDAFRLEFIAYIGDFIIQNNNDLSLEWALLKDKQMLNPNVSIILFSKEREKYFNLEEALFGKYGYIGSENISKSLSIHLIKENAIQQILLFR
ncbi:MAG: hypothetical protein ABI685_06905 [Ferruginibacter sp.]